MKPESPVQKLKRLRDQWNYRGSVRPPFAIEPGPDQESVWDYPRPPRIEDDSRLVKVFVGTTLIAESNRAKRVLETAGAPCFYIPPEDVRTEHLVQNDTRTFCEWKGEGIGFDTVDGRKDVAWAYPETFPDVKPIEGWIAFYASRATCFVDDERVEPQPGGYYGGWITHEVVGPFKAEEIVDDAMKRR